MLISYFALLRNATHKSEEEWTRPAVTVRDLMSDLVAQYGYEFSRWVMKDGEAAAFAIILVDGIDVRSLQGLDTPLHAQSHVLIFPPLAGG